MLRKRLSVSFLIVGLFWAGSVLAVSLPQPTFVGVGQRDGEDRIMLTFADPLPQGLIMGDHVKATIDNHAFSDWVVGSQRKTVWLLDVPDNSKVSLRFVNHQINRAVFSKKEAGQILLSAKQPSLDVAGKGPVIPLQGNPTLPVQLSNVDAVQVELLRVKNPQLLAQRFSPFDAPAPYWLNTLSGAFESLGVSEHLVEPSAYGQAHQVGLPLALDKSGWYLAVLKPAGRFGDESTVVRQIIYTDLAIRIVQFEQGVSVHVTRFSDGTTVTDATVSLSEPNQTHTQPLAKDGSSYFRGEFSSRTLVTVQTADDESHMPLSALPLDLDDFSVGGAATKELDLFATANRNLVAPGSSITITAILRGHDGASVPSQPLSVKWRNSHGELLHTERQSGNDEGLWQFTYSLPKAAKPGLWRALFYTDPNSKAVGEFSFNVDNFVPERINLNLAELAEHHQIDQNLTLPVSAQYLHGAKATGLPIEADISYTSAWSSAVPGWFIGKRFELYASYQLLSPPQLDAEGRTDVTLTSPAQQSITAPVEATIAVSVLDGNSRVQRRRTTTFWPTPQMVGIKPNFDNDHLTYQGTAQISVALFDLGQPSTQQRQVELKVYRDSGDGFWVFDDAEGWVYQRQFGQQPVFNESISVSGKPQQLSFKTDWGRYRIEVTDMLSGKSSDYSFYAGWWGEDQARAFKPTGLDARLVNLDPENLTLNLNAPFDGTLYAQIVTDKPLTSINRTITAGNQQIKLTAKDAANQQDAYVLVTLTGRSDKLPARAMAILPLRWHRQERHLKPSVNLPQEWRPNTEQIVQVDVPGMKQGLAWLMMADSGITNITQYQPLDPFDYTYRKRRLGAALIDFHDRFYNQIDEHLTRTRSGGDTVLQRNGPRAEAIDRLTLLHTSKPVAVIDGKASFNVTLPRYTGEAMVSVVAVNGNRLGQTTTKQRIVSPITVEWRAPQTMVHGDRLHTSVLIRNNQDSPKTINLKSKTHSQLSIELSKSTLTLAPNEQQRIRLTLTSSSASTTVDAVNAVLIAETGSDSFELKQQVFLRARGGESVVEEFVEIQPSSSALFNSEATNNWLGLEQELLISTGIPLDVREHYQRLVGFAYGCSEQTVSQVMSLVLANPDIDRLVGDKGAKNRLDAAVSRLYRRQLSGGGFSLWDNDPIDRWVSVYIADFLQRLSQQRQEPTLDERLSRLLAQVQRFVARPGQLDASARPAVVAYAALLSARAGTLDLSTLAGSAESIGNNTTATADAQLAQAFFLLGDTERSERYLARGLKKHRLHRWHSDYGSDLSDAAHLLIAMGEMRDAGWQVQNNLVTQASERIKTALSGHRWYSTQERLRLVQAATLWRPSGLVSVNIDAQLHEGVGSVYVSQKNIQSLENLGTTPLYVTRRLTGFRKTDTPIQHDELSISQHHYHADGTPANLSNVEVGDLIVVSSQLTNNGKPIENALFVDALPAGFVIENPRLGQGINLDAWQNHVAREPSSERLDYERFEVKRYSAVLSLRGSATLVYQMRAVASGNMADPGASVEDFYAPGRRASTGSTGQLTVLAKR